MTRVLFYVLDSESPDFRYRFICRLVQKVLGRGHRIHVHTGDPQTTRLLDEWLWTFDDQSFLPHSTDTEDCSVRITLHDFRLPSHHDEVLINVSPSVPKEFGRFEQVADVVGGDTISRSAARERFRFFRERGYPLEHYSIS